ncbi:MAG TPA: hypothetical protein VHZ50_11310 [Puia sp.]|nr:hypothetical protein [Puia sp.]
MEWIDKIFDLMQDFFEEEWSKSFKYKEDMSISKTVWQNGLLGLTKDEIKQALLISRNLARNKQSPPNVIEFYHYGKGLRLPPKPPKRDAFIPNPQIAKSSIDTMKMKLRGAPMGKTA